MNPPQPPGSMPNLTSPTQQPPPPQPRNDHTFTPSQQIALQLPKRLPHEMNSEEFAECLLSIRSSQASITCVKFSPCGKFFAFSSADSNVEIYTLQGHPLYRLFGLHRLGIQSLAWSPCSNYIAIGADDGFVSLWNVVEQLPLLLLKAHAHSVLSVAFSPNGNLVASASTDNTIGLFDVVTGALLRQLDAHNDIVTDVIFSRDGSCIISTSNDGTTRVWDVSTGFCLRTVGSESTRVAAGRVAQPHRNPNLLVTTCLDNCVRVYDLPTTTCIALLVGHSNTRYPLQLAFLSEPNVNEVTNSYYQQMKQQHPFIQKLVMTDDFESTEMATTTISTSSLIGQQSSQQQPSQQQQQQPSQQPQQPQQPQPRICDVVTLTHNIPHGNTPLLLPQHHQQASNNHQQSSNNQQQPQQSQPGALPPLPNPVIEQHYQLQMDDIIKTSLHRPKVTYLVAGSEDGGICVWNVKSHSEQFHDMTNILGDYAREREALKAQNSTMSDDSQNNTNAPHNNQKKGSKTENKATIDDITAVKQGELYFKIKSHRDVIRALDCHPFLPLVIAGGMEKDSTLKLWKINKK